VIETLEMKDFLPIAARAMRQVLIDSARRRSAAKRGGGEVRVTLNEELVGGEGSEPGINDLDRALKELGKLSPRMEQVVEMRIFAGIEMEAIAASLGVSVRTAQYDWAVAKKWLAREFSRG
jgi:RNA polymerase sigma factor (TIGR02999 family)